MLDDTQQRALGQIEHLPALAALNDLSAGQIATAAIAALGRMLNPVIR